MILYTILMLWLAYWSAESGASLPWSYPWQNFTKWMSEVPEAILSLTIGFIATFGYCTLIGINPYWSLLMFPIPTAIIYAGQQSATWAYLRWETHTPLVDRQSTLRGWNDFVAGLLGWKSGDEGYSWVWAATKGFITTLPVGGLGVIFFPLAHELGSHARDKLPGEANMWKELASGFGLAVPCIIFLEIIKLI